MTKYVLIALSLAILTVALAPTIASSMNVSGKEMTCDLNKVKTCTLIARHGDIEIDKLIIVNKVGGGIGPTVDQEARDNIAKLTEALNQTNNNLNQVSGQVTGLGNSTINNLVLETQNPENTTNTGNETNQTGGVILPNENNTGNSTTNATG
jgi:hypothetical protein